MRGRKPDASKDARIVELAAKGLTQGQIAQSLLIDRITLHRAAKRLGIRLADGRRLNGKHLVDTDRAASMRALYVSGRTLQEIGDEFGLTRERVRQILRKRTDVTRHDGGQAVTTATARKEQATKRDKIYMEKLGCGWAEYKRIRDLGRELIAAGHPPSKAPMRAFLNQKGSAAGRGIGWELTFWQWWTIWSESGRWAQRGRGQGYVMCRKGDKGPYADGNVFIATAIENISSSKHKKSGFPTGVNFRRGKFEAKRQIAGRLQYLGRFDTAVEAYAAYLAATPPALRSSAPDLSLIAGASS
jgi:DNA-binding CsgD family transcriptional regulator